MCCVAVVESWRLIACTPCPAPRSLQCGGTGGCNGATQELAFGYIAGIAPAKAPGPGITLESDYPYTAQTGSCKPNKIKPVATFTKWGGGGRGGRARVRDLCSPCNLPPPPPSSSSYTTLPFNNYSALMNAVVALGPIAISAAAEPWQIYESGVFSSPCGTDVDHAIQVGLEAGAAGDELWGGRKRKRLPVWRRTGLAPQRNSSSLPPPQLVGYGTDAASGLDYWLVRNSWSAAWGEAGYIRIKRFGDGKEPCAQDPNPSDGDGACVCCAACFALPCTPRGSLRAGCKNGPPSILVCGLCGILSDSSYPNGAALA